MFGFRNRKTEELFDMLPQRSTNAEEIIRISFALGMTQAFLDFPRIKHSASTLNSKAEKIRLKLQITKGVLGDYCIQSYINGYNNVGFIAAQGASETKEIATTLQKLPISQVFSFAHHLAGEHMKDLKQKSNDRLTSFFGNDSFSVHNL